MSPTNEPARVSSVSVSELRGTVWLLHESDPPTYLVFSGGGHATLSFRHQHDVPVRFTADKLKSGEVPKIESDGVPVVTPSAMAVCIWGELPPSAVVVNPGIPSRVPVRPRRRLKAS